MIFYLTVGNSDGKLERKRWIEFVRNTRNLVHRHADIIHGDWESNTESVYQNHIWCFEIDDGEIRPEDIPNLKYEVSEMAGRYGQDSIALAVLMNASVEMIPPGLPDPNADD